MASIELTGTKRALPYEPILLNIWINDPVIEKIRLKLDDLISLMRPLNYNLEKPKLRLKEIEFLVSKLEVENTLTLILAANIPEDIKLSSIIVEGIDSQDNVKLMGTHDVLIMIPNIELSGTTERDKKGQTIISIKMEKVNEMVTTFFNEFKIKILDTKGKKVSFDVIKISDEDYLENLDDIPPIFNPDNFIKEFIIYSNSPCIMYVKARFSDLHENEYKSNICKLYLEPPAKMREEELEKKENVLPVTFSSIQGIEPISSAGTLSAVTT